MRAALLAAAMMCVIGTAGAATYRLTDQVYNQAALDAQPRPGAVYFEMTISDAAVARGSFNLQETAGAQIFTLTGDVADFASASTGPTSGLGQTVTPAFAYFVNLSVSLTFAGNVPSGSISFLTDTGDLRLSGGGGAFSGSFGADYSNCPSTGANLCAVTGQLVASATPSAVPEPASLGLLGAGIAALTVRRRRVG